MKTVVIDARMVGQIGHGISKYVEGIALHLSQSDVLTENILKLIDTGEASQVEFVFVIRPACPMLSPVRKFRTIELDVSCFNPKSWILMPSLLRKLKADLFFNPTFASYPILPCEFVQTVHDLNHLYFGSLLQRAYYSLLLKRSMRMAKRIFTVSSSVKQELVNWAQIKAAKIVVIYNKFEVPKTYSAEQVAQVLNKYSLQSKRYFLCVTNPKPHKNLLFLVKAHKRYLLKMLSSENDQNIAAWSKAFEENQIRIGADEPLPLVITVNSADFTDENRSGLIFAGGIDGDTLCVLYQECAGFYFPSLYEGFGRPPVEASLAGVQNIVVSDLPVHHEAEALAKTKFLFLKV